MYGTRETKLRARYNLAVSECNFDIVVEWMAFRIAFAEDFGVQPSKMGSTWFTNVSYNSQKSNV